MKPKKTWVLVADASGSRVYEKAGPHEHFHEIENLRRTHDHRASHELGSDRPGRVVESVGPTRHAVSPKSDPHRELKRGFAEELAEELGRLADAKQFDRIVVVLPPVMLGDFRKAAGGGLKALVAAEIDKDLTKLSRNDIEARIGEVVMF